MRTRFVPDPPRDAWLLQPDLLGADPIMIEADSLQAAVKNFVERPSLKKLLAEIDEPLELYVWLAGGQRPKRTAARVLPPRPAQLEWRR